MSTSTSTSTSSVSEPTFLERADYTKKALLESHTVLDTLIGIEPPLDGEVWKEPDCQFTKLMQSLSDNKYLAERLFRRIQQLANKI